jgi:peptidoglycan hydrolase-like protein with peptidoglycan-binding domain
VPPPVVYQPAPVYYGTPVPNRYPSQTFVRDEQIMQAQEALRRLGYYKGNIDGLSGPAMRSAVRAYQVDRGLPVTGRLDEDTFQSLGL